jgi:hypothetical protein
MRLDERPVLLLDIEPVVVEEDLAPGQDAAGILSAPAESLVVRSTAATFERSTGCAWAPGFAPGLVRSSTAALEGVESSGVVWHPPMSRVVALSVAIRIARIGFAPFIR